MKTGITILILLISSLAFCQGNVFLTNRTFQYAVEYSTESLNERDTIRITATGRPWKADPQKQLEIIINYNLVSLDTSVYSGLPSIGWVIADTTGAVDNQEACWFHPPRHNQYRLLELAPFPRVEYPLKVGQTYSRILFIGEGWGDISNSKVKWHYEVIDEKGGKWFVSAKAIPVDRPEKVNRLEFVFSETEGFSELQYSFYDGTRINMKK